MNIGFIGASKIGRKMANTIKQVDGLVNYGVAARDYKRAIEYKEELGFTKAYSSYEELLSDPDIDLVYISTIHNLHYEQLLLCLKYNKPVICEKILTTSYEETKNIYRLFEEKDLYLVEALYPGFMPTKNIINDLIYKEKIIGNITKMTSNFIVDIKDVPRVYRKDMGGGALFDIGIYSLSFIFRVLGYDYDSFTLDEYYKEEVDLYAKVTFKYKNILATAIADTRKNGISNVVIEGSNGKMIINSVGLPSLITIYDKEDNIVKEIKLPDNIGGFEFEISHAAKMVKNKQIDNDEYSHANSIAISKTIEKILSLMN